MDIYISRELENEIIPFLERKEILSLVGARQVGKTTLLKRISNILEKDGKKVAFLTFESKENLDLFNDIKDFLDYYKEYQIIIIDEFHYAEDGGKKLKYLFDTTNIKFIISGSSSLELTFQTGKFLVGRMLKFTLYPFSFREFLLAKDKKLHKVLVERLPNILDSFKQKDAFGKELNSRLEEYLEEYLVFGGYPAVVLAKTDKEKIKILQSILDNYLLKDIKDLFHFKNQNEILKIGEFLASQIGNLLNYNELSNSSNVSYKNVLDDLSILENTFVVNLLRPFYKNVRTELVKTPKVYFTDNGLCNYLLSDFRDFSKRNDQGALVENFVCTSLTKNQDLAKINFWRTKSKAEVDFVLRRGGKITPIEVKYSTSPSIGKSLHSFVEKFQPSKAYVFTKGFIAVERIGKTDIYFIPVFYL